MGIMIANVPQLDPIEKAIADETRNTSGHECHRRQRPLGHAGHERSRTQVVRHIPQGDGKEQDQRQRDQSPCPPKADLDQFVDGKGLLGQQQEPGSGQTGQDSPEDTRRTRSGAEIAAAR